ncbi:YrzA family protein [Paenibacillus daejeonensis]|uniref:YrzA family protein n=1 Tax=Paenibacillus daejeonensis TaxID=135193 RepID=UPI00036EC9EF|nr:YrzA family protein [Paenibacillus daejeonensis]
MEFSLSRIENKVEFFQAYDLRSLEQRIDVQIENNKALMLDVASVQHQTVFDPNANKMLYTAVVHFKAKL